MRYRTLILAVSAAIMVVAVSAAAQSVNPKLLKAQEIEANGDFVKAAEIYLELYNADKRDVYFYKLISLYTQLSDYEGLAAIARSKLEDDPDHTEAKRYLARAQYELGETDDSAATLMSIIGGNWKELQRVRIVSGEYTARNDFNEALLIYETAREKIGSPNLFALEMARIHEYREDFAAAIGEYIKLLDTVQLSYQHVQNNINRAKTAGNDLGAIQKIVADYHFNNPESILAAKLLSEMLYNAGYIDRAYSVMFRTAKGQNNALEAWKFAETLRRDGHSEQALSAYREYYNHFTDAKNRVEALKTSASIERDLGRIERAIGDYQRIIENYAGTKDAAEAGLRLIQISADRTSFEGYTRILEEYAASAEFPEVAFEGYYSLGDMYLRHGIGDKAGEVFARAILKARTDDERYKTYMKTAYLRFFENDIELMSDAIQNCMRSSPGDNEVNDLLTFKVIALESVTDAAKEAFEAFAQGHHAMYRGDDETAREYFTTASSDTSTAVAPFALCELGNMARSQENFHEAAEYYLRAARSAGDTTVYVGAVVEAADIFASKLNDKERAKILYLDTMVSFPGSIYENELRNRLRILTE